MDLDIGMFARFIKSTQWIYPVFSFIAHVHREYQYNFDFSDRRKSIIYSNKVIFVSYCNLVGDLLIAFCKDFAMTYERLLRAVAVILTDKAENDDLLLKILFNYLIAVYKIEYFEHLIVTHLNIFKTRSIKDVQIRVEAEPATNKKETELKEHILLALEEKRSSFNLQRKAVDVLLSSEVGLDSELAVKLKQGILVSLNGANVKDRLQARQMQSKLGGSLPPIPDEVSSIKEQIAADQGFTAVEMVEQQFKANLKWISDNMQGVTLSSQKTKAKHHNAKDCKLPELLNQLKDEAYEEESHWFSVYEATVPASMDDYASDNTLKKNSLSPKSKSSPMEAMSVLDSDYSSQLSPTLETIPDLFSVTSFLSKTPKVKSKPELLYVLKDNTARETFLLQEHNYTMKLQLADLALMYNLEQCCDINKYNKEVVLNHRQYEREWNTFIPECKTTECGNYEKAQLAMTWMRKAFRKRYTVEYKPFCSGHHQ